MTSRKFDPKFTPPTSPLFCIKWLFHWQLSTKCHTILYPPPPYLRDVIYKWFLTAMLPNSIQTSTSVTSPTLAAKTSHQRHSKTQLFLRSSISTRKRGQDRHRQRLLIQTSAHRQWRRWFRRRCSLELRQSDRIWSKDRISFHKVSHLRFHPEKTANF